MWVLSYLVLVHLEMGLVFVQDRCTVCTKHSIGSAILLDAPDYIQVTRHKWNLVSVRLEIMLILMQDRFIVYTERTIGSTIILDAPDGTPR
jgi:hypothetical protein